MKFIHLSDLPRLVRFGSASRVGLQREVKGNEKQGKVSYANNKVGENTPGIVKRTCRFS